MAEQDRYDYAIIGAGVAAASAAAAIREKDADGSIAIIGREPDGPVYRPALSKDLWVDGEASLEDNWLLDDGIGAVFLPSISVTAIDTAAHALTLSDASQVGYSRLLIATGAEPRTIDLPDSARVVYYRTAQDYRRLREFAKPGSSAVVVGGGYIGSELAAALSLNDVAVTLIVPGKQVLQQMFPTIVLDEIERALREHGVTLVTGARVTGGAVHGDSVTVTTEAGESYSGDVVVAGLGVVPNDQVTRQAGLEVGNGIVVDERLATSAPDVWAAGDVASYPDALLGVRRVEHVDNAEHQGTTAGHNMAAAAAGKDEETYTYTPIFWSDIYDFGYEAVGTLDASLEMVEDFTSDHSAGVVYYVDGGHVRGVLLWNVWDSTPKAKEVIEQSAQETLSAEQLKGRIPLS